MKIFDETINGKDFRFEQLSVVDSLKIQQTLLRNVNIDFVIDKIKSISEDSNFLESLFPILLKVLQGFDPEQLVTFITDLFIKTKLKVAKTNGEFVFATLENDFKENFNSVFSLVIAILSKNYSNTDFFLNNAVTQVVQMNKK